MDVLVCLSSKCYCIIVFLVLLLMALFFWCCCVYWVSVVLHLSGCFYLPQYFPLGSSLCPLSLVVRLLDPFMLLWSLLVSMFLSLCPLLSMLTGVLCLLCFCLFFMHFKLWSLFHFIFSFPVWTSCCAASTEGSLRVEPLDCLQSVNISEKDDTLLLLMLLLYISTKKKSRRLR